MPLLAGAADSHLTFHNDSNHQINFRYADKQRGLKPFIVPSALIATGTLLHFSDAKYRLNDWRSEHFNYQGSLDDYLRLGPVAAVYALNAFGVKGKNNLGNQTALLLKTMVLTSVVTKGLKNLTAVERPGGDAGSMPSGHTSIAFAAAQWMHREYGERSTWYSVGAYACATTVGVMRVAKGSHWASDVLVGAGLGMLTTEFIYLTHQYKWDREHLRNFDIFPFQLGQQKGLSLVYHF
ncbi:phosphatase PAP2 family protein [uncultured Draconibacterium sp.]|uniref:phosphatase PAP2 family protein n=1 Tax=uncultured Draconibacterium sp. TaxID=1573823 RepID=UPI0025CE6B4B|nr:phosphatase PAP2 family protein [uncultured Draconibacterium sp.]